MGSLLIFFSKYNAIFFFILLEILSIFLIVNYNNKQKDIFLYSSNLLVGKINEKRNNLVQYLNLEKSNERLKKDNALLIQNYFNSRYTSSSHTFEHDTIVDNYTLIPASICNKSITNRNNRFTLDKGENEGIKKGMGVLSAQGIIGVVRKVNSDYASVIPLNNSISRTSVMVKNKNYFGILQWKPYDYTKTILHSIPKHAKLEVGDSIITSGFSTIFPKGIFVGTIEEINLNKGSNYFEILIKLVNNLALEQDVYVIGNKKKELKIDVEE